MVTRYAAWGNEKLAPLAYGGDADATLELEERGNKVIVSRKVIQRTVVWGPQNGNQCKPGSTVVIENGKIVSIDGIAEA